MQLGIYVNKEHEPNVRVLQGLAQTEARTMTSLVHEAIEFYLLARWTIADVQESARARGRTPAELVKDAVEYYLTVSQEV
jgi:predicted DNA-binding protein